MPRPSRLYRPFLGAILALLAAGAPALADDPRASGPAAPVPETGIDERENGALEMMNRTVDAFNTALRERFVEPGAAFAAERIPEPVQAAIANIVANLREPLTAFSSAMAGDSANAHAALARFAINTTFGLGGVNDVAGDWGLKSRALDLGQAFCAMGVPQGPYLVLPLLGPTTARDLAGDIATLGLGGDLFGDGFVAVWAADAGLAALARAPAAASFDRWSVDSYTARRSAYLQSRRHACANGAGAPPVMPDSDFALDD